MTRKPLHIYTGNDVVDLYYEDHGERIQRAYWRDPAALSDLELLYLSIFHVDGEIRNGGIEQAVANPGGDVVPLAHASLIRIGAAAAAEILLEVISRFPSDTDWGDQDERESAFYEAFGNDAGTLDELDKRWMDNQDDMYEALARHIGNATASALPN